MKEITLDEVYKNYIEGGFIPKDRKYKIKISYQKWFRTFSKPSRNRSSNTNWENFPEEEFRDQLSEEGFLQFIRDYLTS